MKNGKPSRLSDIRYFVGHRAQYLEDHGTTAYGRRLAWVLNSEDVSLGSFNSLYICFSDELPCGEVEREPSHGGETWWQEYCYVGTRGSIAQKDDPFGLYRQGTIAALKSIRPDISDLVDWADGLAMKEQAGPKFLVRSKEYAKIRLDLATTIAVHPAQSEYYALLTMKANSSCVEMGPIASGVYFMASAEMTSIGLKDFDITLGSDGRLVGAHVIGRGLSEVSGVADSRKSPNSIYTKLIRH